MTERFYALDEVPSADALRLELDKWKENQMNTEIRYPFGKRLSKWLLKVIFNITIIELTTVDGTDTFDAGMVHIRYE